MRLTLLVFGFLSCLYLISGGGQGYSVDGTFSYQLSRNLAAGGGAAFLAQNRSTLQRWGPVTPLLGVPFSWLGLQLGRIAPRPDSLRVAGYDLRLYDWPPLGPLAGTPAGPSQPELALQLPTASGAAPAQPIESVDVVSFLSFGAALPQGAPVAELRLRRPDGTFSAPVTLRAGIDTAEWAFDVPGTARPQHARPAVAGHWAGRPDANLYATRLAVPSGAATEAVLRYVAPEGRLHLRALAVSGRSGAPETAGYVEPPGPALWSAGAQADLFARFGFSFLNAPQMALCAALLVPLARALGYSTYAAVVLALVYGTATLAWPYAKLDFSETAATAFAVAAAVCVYAAQHPPRQRRHLLLAAGGLLICLAAGAKYSAIWFAPLLGLQVGLLWLAGGRRYARTGRSWRAAAGALAAFTAIPVVGAVTVLALVRGGPAIWQDWRGVFSRGWLDFPIPEGLYGLLLSPGKSVFLYAPPLLLALASALPFARRHRWSGALFFAIPVTYLLLFAGKGVWHGGGWGPRYLVPAIPFALCLALPVIERAVQVRGVARVAVAAAWAAGVLAQVLGVAKHPNQYTVMFHDHVLPALPDYGAPLGGPAAVAYWRHFGGPEAGRQLARPPDDADTSGPRRGLGYAYAESGPLTLDVTPAEARRFTLSLYACDWDHRGRRQRVTVADALGTRTYAEDRAFSACEYLSWLVDGAPGTPVRIDVQATGPDTPVLSGLFFDPPRGDRAAAPTVDGSTGGAWPGHFGADGYVLLAWDRGADVARLPAYVTRFGGGDRVWIDTGEADLADTALLYAPVFSPLLGHAWLLAGDAVFALFPRNVALQQKALASPPWRVLAGLGIQPPHPEFGLGLDFWQLLLRAQLSSHRGFMTSVWAVTTALLVGMGACAAGLLRAARPPIAERT